MRDSPRPRPLSIDADWPLSENDVRRVAAKYQYALRREEHVLNPGETLEAYRLRALRDMVMDGRGYLGRQRVNIQAMITYYEQGGAVPCGTYLIVRNGTPRLSTGVRIPREVTADDWIEEGLIGPPLHQLNSTRLPFNTEMRMVRKDELDRPLIFHQLWRNTSRPAVHLPPQYAWRPFVPLTVDMLFASARRAEAARGRGQQDKGSFPTSERE